MARKEPKTGDNLSVNHDNLSVKRQSPLVFSELRHAGGAIARVDADSNAVGNREATFNLVMGALVITPEARRGITAAIEHYKADLRPYLRGGVYLNFMSGFLAGSELAHRTKDAYLHKTFERLVALKAKYDPENVFRFSYQLVAPGAGEA